MRKVVSLSNTVTAISYFPETRIICRLACNGGAAAIIDRPIEDWEGEMGDNLPEDKTCVVLLDKDAITAMYKRLVLGEDE